MFEKVTVGKAFEPVAVDAFMTILGMKTLDELVQSVVNPLSIDWTWISNLRTHLVT